jgi:tubulin--tyrosine ligase
MRDIRSILSVIDNAQFGQTDWVVSRYIERPLLLRGRRKFDIRTWVLLDADYRVFMYRY